MQNDQCRSMCFILHFALYILHFAIAAIRYAPSDTASAPCAAGMSCALPSVSSAFAAGAAAAAASAAISSFVFFGFGKLAGAPGSGTLFGADSFASAAFCAASCVPLVPYFLISTATFSDGCAPTPNQ